MTHTDTHDTRTRTHTHAHAHAHTHTHTHTHQGANPMLCHVVYLSLSLYSQSQIFKK